MLEQVRNHKTLLVCMLLGVVTLGVYLPVWKHEFVRYDDDVYVTQNPNVKSGLSWEGVKWAFTSGYASNWHPLTWLSHQLDWQLFGDKAGAHHIVNVLFHIANTILLFVVLNRMTKGLWQSAFVAGLFALHPLHVESVAWVAERKDVLSTLFLFLTMLFYVRYTERPSAWRYVAVLVLFALGLMAKPMLVTLPFVLLLLDYWPLKRFGNPKNKILHLLLEKVPLLFLSAASSVVTYLVQEKTGAMTPLPINERVTNAICSYLAYTGKMLWPSQLAVLYPHPLDTLPVTRAVAYGVILAVITLFFFYYGRRHKYLIVGWLWYIGTLVPVIGIVQVGSQAMADRYTYIPLIGLFIIIAFGASELFRRIPLKNIILTASAISILVVCAIVTRAQLQYWRNSYSLFDRALAVIEDNAVMQNNYANILSELGRPEEAARHLSESLKYIPNSPAIHNNYGNALREMGKLDEAIEHYKFALELDPTFSVAHYNLGITMAMKGDYEEAIRQYKEYLGPDANIADLHEGLATMLAREGKVADAVGQFQKALAAKPDSA